MLFRSSIVGPYAVLGEGTTVETGAVVQRSVLLGAHVGEGAEVTGAILCKGAVVRRRAMVGTGAVLGEEAVAEDEAIVAPGVKLWPGRRVAEGAKATASLVAAGQGVPLRFSAGGALRGTAGEELTAEVMLSLGALLGEEGRVALGWAGGEAAALLGRSAACGVTAAGGEAILCDAPCASAGAWLGRFYGLPVTLFVQQDGDTAEVRLFDEKGLPLSRSRQRKLEGALLRGEATRVPASRVGRFQQINGAGPGCAGETARVSRLSSMPLRPLAVQVEKGEGANDILTAALTALGCQVSRGSGRGKPTFSADWGGFRLTVWDEEGRRIGPDRLLVLLTRIEMENGEKTAVLPAWAPTAAETVAEGLGGRLLRLGRDGAEAQMLWEKQVWMWDGIAAACRLCARMGLTGESLAHLDSGIPRFATARREVPLRSGRGRVMGAALADSPRVRREGEGVRIPAGDGWIYLVPASRRSALRIIAEAADMETAEELCHFYEERLRRWDEESGDRR